MKFSTKSTYGIRAMVSLAKHDKKTALSLARIAEEEKISLGYLERIFSKLKKANLVVSERGLHGGYRLAKNPKEISIHEIVSSLEGGLSYFSCVDEKGNINCGQSGRCGAVKVLSRLQGAVNNTLVNFKLSELV